MVLHDRDAAGDRIQSQPLSSIRDNFRPTYAKTIRLELVYLPSSYREETVNFAVSIGDK